MRPCSPAWRGVGEVFALEFNPNNPFLLLGGGSTAEELVWTVSEDIRACEFSLAPRAAPRPPGVNSVTSPGKGLPESRSHHRLGCVQTHPGGGVTNWFFRSN